MSGWVTFTGPPDAIWRENMWMTLPLDPMPLPNRTATNRVAWSGDRSRWQPMAGCLPLRLCTYISARRLVAPMMLVGLTALSVLTMTKAAAAMSRAASATDLVPKRLFLMASPGLRSIMGTCLWAAQWKMTWGC